MKTEKATQKVENGVVWGSQGSLEVIGLLAFCSNLAPFVRHSEIFVKNRRI